MKLKQMIAGAAAALALATAAANAAVVIEKKHHIIVAPNRAVASRVIDRGRVVEVVRAQHIRFVGQPYMYRGEYVMRCFDRFGRHAFCRVNPRNGAFLGVSVRL